MSIRNLARHIQVAIAEPELSAWENKAVALRLLGAFAIATNLHLRKEPFIILKIVSSLIQVIRLR